MATNEDDIPTAQPEEPITVKVADEEPAGEWKMPEPVFRCSSGQLPKGYDKRAAAAAAPSAAGIQPQPDISDEFTLAELSPASAATDAKRGASRIALLVLGLLLMLVFAAAFLTVIYFLFFYQPEANNLN